MSEDVVDVRTVQVDSFGIDDPEWVTMQVVAKKAAMLLSRVYANHTWMIGTAPGMTLVIKHMAGDNRYGYTVDCAAAYSSSQLEHAIIMGGGELLERMGLARGAWDGELIGQKYEGQEEVT